MLFPTNMMCSQNKFRVGSTVLQEIEEQRWQLGALCWPVWEVAGGEGSAQASLSLTRGVNDPALFIKTLLKK